MNSVIERDSLVNNLLDRTRDLEERLAEIERLAATGLFDGTALSLPGTIRMMALPTESLEVLDAGSTGATEQDWIEVAVEGVTGYIWVRAGK